MNPVLNAPLAVLLFVCVALGCSDASLANREAASPELGEGGAAVVDWTPLLRGGARASSMAGAAGSRTVPSGGAAIGGESPVLLEAGAAGCRTVPTGSAATGGESPVLLEASPAGAPSAGRSSTEASPGGAPGSTQVRVVFAATYGVPDDDEINTLVALENLGTESLALRGIELRYWVTMAFVAIECSCLTAVCSASTVGAFRTPRAVANTGIGFALPAGWLRPGQSLTIDFVCRYTNGAAIDERTHYSYPQGLQVGDEMPRVTVSAGTKLIWGVEPQ